MIKYTTMKRMGLFKTVSLLLGCLTMFSCVDYDDIQPFTGKTLPRKSGYSTGVTNDWIYFNLRTGESFNTYTVNKDIKEGEQINRTDWDLAFCGYTMRTNSGTSGIGQGGAADLGYGGYDDWTSVSQLPSDLEWVVDTDDVRVTMSQNDWNHYLVENNLDFLYPGALGTWYPRWMRAAMTSVSRNGAMTIFLFCRSRSAMCWHPAKRMPLKISVL